MLQQLVAFEDRIDGYYSDKSTLTSFGNTLVYFTQSGTRVETNLSRSNSNPEIKQKLCQMLSYYNKYSDVPIYCGLTIDQDDCVTKLNKATFCNWSSTPQKSESGHRVYSLDRQAYVELDNNMMIVRVSYWQLLNRKCLRSTVQSQNATKSLLNKYNLQYQSYPETVKVTTVAHKYLRQSKTFSISQIPKRWQYPVSLLWKLAIQNPQNTRPVIEPCILVKTSPTIFPECQYLEDQKEIATTSLSVPVFRFPRHSSTCLWLLNLQDEQNIGWLGRETVCYDGRGIWVAVNQCLHLKFTNTIDSAKIYNVNAIPLVVRCGNYQKRVKDFLIAVYNASQQQERIQFQKATSYEQRPYSNKQTQQVSRTVHEQGTYIAYSNRIVTAKFNDGVFTIINFNNETVKIRGPEGSQVQTTTYDKFYSEYLKPGRQFYESVFFPLERQKKLQLAQESQLAISRNQSVLAHLKSGQYKYCSHNSSLEETFDVQQMIQRNQEVLKKLQRFG